RREATNGLAVQRLTWTHPHHRPTLIFWDIQIGERRLVFSRATANPDFSGSLDTSVCVDFARKSDQVAVISMNTSCASPPFYGSQGGGKRADYKLRFFYASSTERQDTPRALRGR